jgi:hypothetical protein
VPSKIASIEVRIETIVSFSGAWVKTISTVALKISMDPKIIRTMPPMSDEIAGKATAYREISIKRRIPKVYKWPNASAMAKKPLNSRVHPMRQHW